MIAGLQRWSADRQLPGVLGTLCLAIFVIAAAPGPYWSDSQELASAGVLFGVPHPSGFPAFCILANLASLLPFGELAFRVHLVSVCTAALTVFFAVRFLVEQAEPPNPSTPLLGGLVGGALVAVLLASSTTFFRHATSTEVYAPTAAMAAASLFLVARIGRANGNGNGQGRGNGQAGGWVLALLIGIGAVGLHSTYALLVGLPALVAMAIRLRHGDRWVLAVPALAGLGAMGMLVYLPLRSASGRVPLVDWGHPSGWSALLTHLSGERIRSAFQEQLCSTVPEIVLENASSLASVVEGDLGVLVLGCALAGIGSLLVSRRGRAIAVFLVIMAIGDFVYGAWVNPMGIEDRQNGVLLTLAVAVLAGFGVAAVGKRLGRAAPFVASAVAIVAAIPAALSALEEKASTRTNEAPRKWAEAALASCPARAIALAHQDSTAAGMVWLSVVEGARPDLAILVRQHLWDRERNRHVFARAGMGSELSATSTNPVDEIVASQHSICWESGIDDVPSSLVITPGVPLAVARRRQIGDGDDSGIRTESTATAATQIRASLAVLGRVFDGNSLADSNGRRLYAAALTALGRGTLGVAPAHAAALFQQAAAVDPRFAAPWVDLGVVAAHLGDLPAAIAATEQALRISPNRLVALTNGARFYLASENDPAAHRLATRAVRVAPRKAEAWSILGVLEARKGNYPAARRCLEQALSLDPANRDARVNLAKLPASQ
ncbi:MAG: DUF2723 domain-containing protein [Pseudomonadota bacterium]